MLDLVIPWRKELKHGMQEIPPKTRPSYATKENIFTPPRD